MLWNCSIPKKGAEIFALVSVIYNKQCKRIAMVAQSVQMLSLDFFSWRYKPDVQGRARRKALTDFPQNAALATPRGTDKTR